MSMDVKQCVCSFDIFPTLHEASELSAGRFVPGGAVLAVNASGEEVADTCFCARGWVHDCFGELVGKEVCVVWVSRARGGNKKVACLVGQGGDGWYARGWVLWHGPLHWWDDVTAN